MERKIFGTFIGVVPTNYVKVSRWIGQNEIDLWKRETTHIPFQSGRGSQLYVTLAGAPKPRSNVGPFRVDFFVPEGMLQRGGSHPDDRFISGERANTPIYNVEIFDCR
jgi:hypothetical protein